MAFEYNPGVTSTVGQTAQQGNQLLAQVLMQVMDGMGQQKEKQRLEAKSTKDMGSAADAWFRALGEDAPKVTGMQKEQWDIQGAADKSNAMHGVIQSQATQNLLMQQAQQRRQDEGQTALQRALGDSSAPTMSPFQTIGLGQGPINPPEQQGTMLERLVSAMQQNPESINAPQGASLLLHAISAKGARPGAGAPEGTNIGGVPVIFNRQTGAFQLDPAYKIKQEQDATRIPGQITPALQFQDLSRQETALRKNLGQLGADDNLINAQLADIAQRKQELLAPSGKATPPAAAVKVTLTHEQALKFLQQVDGDKAKARKLAKDAGFTF